jgi:hypothetical protein
MKYGSVGPEQRRGRYKQGRCPGRKERLHELYFQQKHKLIGSYQMSIGWQGFFDFFGHRATGSCVQSWAVPDLGDARELRVPAPVLEPVELDRADSFAFSQTQAFVTAAGTLELGKSVSLAGQTVVLELPARAVSPEGSDLVASGLAAPGQVAGGPIAKDTAGFHVQRPGYA